jgi:hypothetical protein
VIFRDEKLDQELQGATLLEYGLEGRDCKEVRFKKQESGQILTFELIVNLS